MSVRTKDLVHRRVVKAGGWWFIYISSPNWWWLKLTDVMPATTITPTSLTVPVQRQYYQKI